MASAAAAVTVLTARGLRIVPRPIRVLTVDGHQLVREGLAAMIDREEDMTVVATAATGAEALHDVHRYRPDVVTLDLVLPDMPGDVLAQRILEEFPEMRILVITSAQGPAQTRRALDAGVQGYLSKAASGGELLQAIRRVQAGGRLIPGPVASRIAGTPVNQELTAREIQVLQLVAWGYRNKHVAAQLSITGEAVRMHLRSILEKLSATDRTHAVTIAVTRGILRLGDGPRAASAEWTQ